MMKILVLLVITLSSYSSLAGETFYSKYLGFAQGILTKVLGEEKVKELYGIEEEAPPLDQILMPKIPQAKKDTTSTESHTLGLSAKSKFRFLTEQQVQAMDYTYLNDLYLAVRRSKASEQELSLWMNTLNQGGSREGVYRALVLDGKYAELENQASTLNPKVIDFTVKFMEKYLAQKVKSQNLEPLNIYSLKRILTEKTLDTFDEIKKKPEDFYNWYALMQAELAEEYSSLLKGKMAKESDPAKHKHWAQEMPEQHLKSELILKLHTILNSLI